MERVHTDTWALCPRLSKRSGTFRNGNFPPKQSHRRWTLTLQLTPVGEMVELVEMDYDTIVATRLPLYVGFVGVLTLPRPTLTLSVNNG
jgi:hypothetical protein